MDDYDNPQQTVTVIDDLIFFSNFDSGNLSKVEKTCQNIVKKYLVWINNIGRCGIKRIK